MHTNRLAGEKSPYLLQHAHNPVDWHPWGEAAFEKARAEDRPIFLSVGYSTCHWCHVMERESFESEETAALLNRYFIPVKVDREERPDVDRIYMLFVQATTGGGGWPMSVFLTPDLNRSSRTYFPPDNVSPVGFFLLQKSPVDSGSARILQSGWRLGAVVATPRFVPPSPGGRFADRRGVSELPARLRHQARWFRPRA
jgi:uncharacterized protein YyaL (SSP411 family)